METSLSTRPPSSKPTRTRAASQTQPAVSTGRPTPARKAPAKKAPAKPRSRASWTDNHLFDARPDRLDFRDLRYEPPLRSLPPHFPTTAHLAQAVPSYVAAKLVRDQGREGACTGFGLAAVVNYLLWLREIEQPGANQGVRVSPYMFYELARRYDEWEGEAYEGSSCRGALKGFHKHGVCEERYWPKMGRGKKGGRTEAEWDVNALQNPLGVYYRIDKSSVVEMQSAIADIGAVYVSAQVHDGWDNVPHLTKAPTSHDEAELPTIPPRRGPELGGHAFALVGYNERGFIVQNSWGGRWGAAGFAVMPYADWVQYGTDAWALGLGVPQRHDISPERVAAQRWPHRSGRSLKHAGRQGKSPDNPLDDPWPIDREFDHKPYQPWSTAKAYEHTLVTGNNGHVVITDLSAGIDGDVAAFVQTQVDRALGFFQKQPEAHLMVYAHGGLNSEGESIDRIRVLAPYFEANGVYPLFLSWRTGPLETLAQMLEDKLRKAFGIGDERARGMLESLGEARDRSVEVIASKAIKGLWSEMRQNARLGAHKGRGTYLLAEALAGLQGRLGRQPLRLHLVGHSAGSIVLGHLVERLAANQVKATSCSLYAPACTVGFAIEKYLRAGAPVIQPRQMHLHYLTDRQEKDDDMAQVGPVTLYGKSLLYLVSRALDDVRKMPLLGMERAHDPAFFNEDQWARQQLDTLTQWRAAFPAANRHPIPAPYIRVNKQGKTEQATHGSFDNNIEVIEATLRRITGRAPVSPIEWLDY
jgi:hypothetical protein